jgi:hypothetical protein
VAAEIIVAAWEVQEAVVVVGVAQARNLTAGVVAVAQVESETPEVLE